MKTNTPGSKTISLPSKVKIPFPSMTLTVAFRAEVCSEISVPAARQNKLYWQLLSLTQILLNTPAAGYSIVSRSWRAADCSGKRVVVIVFEFVKIVFWQR